MEAGGHLTSNLGVRGSNPFRRAKHLAPDFRAKNYRFLRFLQGTGRLRGSAVAHPAAERRRGSNSSLSANQLFSLIRHRSLSAN